jgi:hypothetical protein
MKNFQISLKELIVIIILSAPIGIFIFLHNYNKINYEVKARRGFVVTENFCENYAYQKIYLQKDSEVDLVSEKYKSSQSEYSRFGSKLKILTRNDADTYNISIKGFVGEEEAMAEMGNKILQEILESELLIFNNLYKSVKLHCKSGDFIVFKKVPLQKIDIQFPAARLYKNLHLGFILIMPLSIIYLLLIAFKYISKISIKK